MLNLSGSDLEFLQKFFLMRLFFHIMGNIVFNLLMSLSMRIAMRSLLLNDIVRD